MAGLIDQALPAMEDKTFTEPGKISQAGATGYDPNLGVVNLETDSVSGQLDKILSKDSPLVTRARAGAAQVANSRGLLNSTMAASAGEAAAIDTALPIAQQDASMFTQQRLANQQAGNTASQFGADAANKFAQQKLAGEQESSLMSQKAEIDRQMQSADAATREKLLTQQGALDRQLQELRGQQETGLQAMRGEQQTGLQRLVGEQQQALADTEARYKTLMQANDSAAQVMAQSTAAINEILNNPEIPVAQKNQLIAVQRQLLENELSVIGATANVDYSGLLDFGDVEEPVPQPAEGSAFTQAQLDEMAALQQNQTGVPPSWQSYG